MSYRSSQLFHEDAVGYTECQSYSGGSAFSLCIVFILQSPCTFRCEDGLRRLVLESVTNFSEVLTVHLSVRKKSLKGPVREH
jgi:hypothetical protein